MLDKQNPATAEELKQHIYNNIQLERVTDIYYEALPDV